MGRHYPVRLSDSKLRYLNVDKGYCRMEWRSLVEHTHQTKEVTTSHAAWHLVSSAVSERGPFVQTSKKSTMSSRLFYLSSNAYSLLFATIDSSRFCSFQSRQLPEEYCRRYIEGHEPDKELPYCPKLSAAELEELWRAEPALQVNCPFVPFVQMLEFDLQLTMRHRIIGTTMYQSVTACRQSCLCQSN